MTVTLLGMTVDMIILGIDPGFGRTGWGVLQDEQGQLKMIAYGCIETAKEKEFSQRLEILYKEVKQIIKKFKPNALAVEELFFCKNITTAIKVSHARGVILLAGKQAKISVYEFTPLQVKQAVSGYGKADKQQVQQMVKTLLGLKEIPKPDDAADALAVAICGANCRDALQRVSIK